MPKVRSSPRAVEPRILRGKGRGRKHVRRLFREAPRLTYPQILAWIDAWRKRTGLWPHKKAGRIPGALGETWNAIHIALARGRRGLPGGSTLAKFLRERRGVRKHHRRKPLTEAQILAWAQAHHLRTGEWPHCRSGRCQEHPVLTWNAINMALIHGHCGALGGSCLATLLNQIRGKPDKAARDRNAVERYQQGESLEQIGPAVALSSSGVRDILKRHQVQRRPRHKYFFADSMTTTDKQRWGRRLKAWRRSAGLSQQALARRAGLHAHTIAGLECGHVAPLRETVQRLATALAMDPNVLFTQHPDSARSIDNAKSSGPGGAATIAAVI